MLEILRGALFSAKHPDVGPGRRHEWKTGAERLCSERIAFFAIRQFVAGCGSKGLQTLKSIKSVEFHVSAARQAEIITLRECRLKAPAGSAVGRVLRDCPRPARRAPS